MLDGAALFLRGLEIEGKIALHPEILMREEKANMLLCLVGGQKASGTFGGFFHSVNRREQGTHDQTILDRYTVSYARCFCRGRLCTIQTGRFHSHG
jgi:hypothetical protein